jgi:hypothetical protein
MTTAPVGCLDGEQAIRDALAAGTAPGLWKVGKLEKPQLLRFYVYRDISPSPTFTHFEQLQCADGGCARFETEEEALAAIAPAPQQAQEAQGDRHGE